MEVFARLPVELRREVLSYGTVPEFARPCPGCGNILMRKPPGSPPSFVREKFHVPGRYWWFCPRCLLIRYERRWKCCNPVKILTVDHRADRQWDFRREYDRGNVEPGELAVLRARDLNVHVVLCNETLVRGIRTCTCPPAE